MGQAKQRKALMGEDYGKKPNHWKSQPQNITLGRIKTTHGEIFFSSVRASCPEIDALAEFVGKETGKEIPVGCNVLRMVLGVPEVATMYLFTKETWSCVVSTVKPGTPQRIHKFLTSQEFLNFAVQIASELVERGRVEYPI